MGKKKKKKHRKKKIKSFVKNSDFITTSELKEIKEGKMEGELKEESLKEKQEKISELSYKKSENNFFKNDLIRILLTISLVIIILIFLGYLIFQKNLFNVLWQIKI